MRRGLIAAIIVILILLATGCGPTQGDFQKAVFATLTAYPTVTPYPSLTPFPTYTPYATATQQPALMVTRVVIQTPTPKYTDSQCKPMDKMDYSNNSKAALMLQSYVASLPGVRQVSYVIPEKLYSNTLSQLYHVTYVDDNDGKVYSKRYIVYMSELGWTPKVFSIDGQCWIN